MKKYLLILLLACISAPLHADELNTLLQTIRNQSSNELTENSERVKRFKAEEAQQQAALDQAKKSLQILVDESNKLQTNMEENEQRLAEAETTLQQKSGDLGELFGAIRQIAGELKADFDNSATSAQFTDRTAFLNKMAQSRALPNTEDLEHLWFLMLQEMGELGKTRQFQATVTQQDGTQSQQDVIRIGAYTLVSNGEFLQYHPETQQLSTLQQQPDTRYTITAASFPTESTQDLHPIMIDPTRGQLLTMMTLKPSLLERIQQGGYIGYIIITLGIIGLLIALVRYIQLAFINKRMARQAQQIDKPSNDNPLGRVIGVYQQHKQHTLPEQETALEEAILKELPSIERYNGLIKLLASVSPLLGLLGTVIGMIIVFQTITLFGTSDPKLMAGGIATALVTTALGLSVALPLLFAHTFISAKSKHITDQIEHQSLGLIARSL